MCGIVGYINKKLQKNRIQSSIEQALKKLDHRGPDSSSYYKDNDINFLFGMTRLSILDYDNGSQPFFSENRKYALIFNGEIVNSGHLRKQLEKKNIKFKSKNSDTEVLLNLLILEREKCLLKLNGMFSFCFYDLEKKEVLIARDRFGIKPFYYFFNNYSFGFSSEIKNLISFYPENLKINNQSLYDYFSLMFIPSPNTIFENIKRLSAGTLLKINLKNFKKFEEKWYEPNFKPDNSLSKDEIPSQIENLSCKLIDEWSLSDVPISNSLSGGIDSSVISGLANKQNIKIKNFTLGFKNVSDKEFSETYQAKKLSEKLNQDHEIFEIAPHDFLEKLDRILEDIHEPYGGGLPSWMVYNKISKNYKVAFTGTGIDEFFGNYSKWKKLDTFWKKKIDYMSFCKSFFDQRYYASDEQKKKLLNLNIKNIEPTSLKFYNKFNETDGDIKDKSALLDIKTQLTDEFLNISDIFSMSFSLEVRPLYLDNNLTDFFFKIPSKFRVGNHKNLKSLFKSSFKNILTKEIISGNKKGFILPIENWLKNDLIILANKFFSKKKINEHGLIDYEYVKNLFDKFLNRSKLFSRFDRYHRLQTLIWGILMFQLWFEKNINKKKIVL